MNARLHKVVFSKSRNAFVVVSDISSGVSRGGGKASSSTGSMATTLRVATSGVALSLQVAISAWSAGAATDMLPTGASVAQGSVSVTKTGNVLTLNQSTDKAVVNFQSFNIGSAAKVNIQQPSSSSVQLDRVTGNSPSQIMGQLTSNGQVILVNPNGIVVGKDGSVSASAFTASTLGISDADFMAGNYRFTGSGAAGSVVNQGFIKTTGGGYVALIGANVTNDGHIVAPDGAVYLGAAKSISLPVTSSGKVKLELSSDALNASVVNTDNGVIVAEGGQVYIQAAALNDAAAIAVSGNIDVSGAHAGNVTILADAGQIKVNGAIKANSTIATDTAGGNIVIGRDVTTGKLSANTDVSGADLQAKGGFIETSGEVLKSDGVKVQASQWLLDPYNVEINGGTSTTPNTAGDSVVLASAISTALTGGTSVTISTTGTQTGVAQTGGDQRRCGWQYFGEWCDHQ